MSGRFARPTAVLASWVRRTPGAQALMGRWRAHQGRRVQARLAGPRLIRAFGEAYPRAVFIEIGANDGQQHDHLRPMILERDWHGVMVEPVPYVFERLRRNYGMIDRVALENAALGDHDGSVPFYHLAPVADRAGEGLPEWYDGIGSLSRAAVLGHAAMIPDIEQRVVETEVPSLTFETLCARHAIGAVDLILIDTEGHDHMILAQIDFAVHRPALVVYEHYHLRVDDRTACLKRMRDHGYETMEEGFDTWCLRPDADPQLTRAWSRLRPAVGGVSAHDGAA